MGKGIDEIMGYLGLGLLVLSALYYLASLLG